MTVPWIMRPKDTGPPHLKGPNEVALASLSMVMPSFLFALDLLVSLK